MSRESTETSELSLRYLNEQQISRGLIVYCNVKCDYRFRHLDTMVRLKTGTGSRRGSSNGCSPEPSPAASPSRGRSPNGRA